MSISLSPVSVPAEAKPDDDGLDPEIRAFVRGMSERWRQHPPLASVGIPEARKIAEEVRSVWTEGGPRMARTTEIQVPMDEGSVRIRILQPEGASAQPALVYLHGGGWTIFSIDTHDRLMREYAGRAGITVVAVDYSLSPEVRFPRAIEETLAVVHWLRANGGAYGIDAARIAIGGDSAGAAMTLAVCMMLRDAGLGDAVSAMLLNYGAYDAACDTPSYDRYGNGGYMWDSGEMAAFWANYLADPADALNPLACPIRGDVHDLPPSFHAIPECDVMFDEARVMAEKLRVAGNRAQTVIYPGATHSFLEAVSVARIADRAFDEASRWLKDMLDA
ncbi:alpha/beta hydrolase fold domain-containing protein [Sphingomonas colocasiae]|uniref:Alpha/beta hydrolase fold domain-containing protein n=1 Tax=Sphingomonas colocasiae TaxID=1848973 RepID=A0ABS7PM95_9SPHN|nr:alpha/beta hydrolase fold domain-containing protein [Sphingomonas colocasiae]MBY8822428.1 alpha/beta hydrolase fold domain-containing protein [Sphingomonas colocasiae]